MKNTYTFYYILFTLFFCFNAKNGMLLFDTQAKTKNISTWGQDEAWRKRVIHTYPQAFCSTFFIPKVTIRVGLEAEPKKRAKPLHWFSKQYDAFSAHQEGVEIINVPGKVHFPLFSRDIHFRQEDLARFKSKGQVPPLGAKKFGCHSLQHMYVNLVHNSPISRGGPCYYQMIMEGVPCKLYVDAEADLKFDFFFDGDAFSLLFERDMRTYLSKVCGLGKLVDAKNVDGTKYLIEMWKLDASRLTTYENKRVVKEGKWSSHFILQAVFLNNYHVGRVVKDFLKWTVSEYGEPDVRTEIMEVEFSWGKEMRTIKRNTNPYFLHKIEKSANQYLHQPVIDESVYTKLRSFRVDGGSKEGDHSRIFVKGHSCGETAESIARRRAAILEKAEVSNIYDIKHRDFIGSCPQDALFSQLWLEHYGNFIAVKVPGTQRADTTITSCGVSRKLTRSGTSANSSNFHSSLGEGKSRANSVMIDCYSKASSMNAEKAFPPTIIPDPVYLQTEVRRQKGGGEMEIFHLETFRPPSEFEDRENGKRAFLDTQILSMPGSIQIRENPDGERLLTFDNHSGNMSNPSISGTHLLSLESLIHACAGLYPCAGAYSEEAVRMSLQGLYCENKKAAHATRGMYIIINFAGMFMSHKCWKDGCKIDEGRRPMWNLRRLKLGNKKAGLSVDVVRDTMRKVMKGKKEIVSSPETGAVDVYQYTTARFMTSHDTVEAQVGLIYHDERRQRKRTVNSQAPRSLSQTLSEYYDTLNRSDKEWEENSDKESVAGIVTDPHEWSRKSDTLDWVSVKSNGNKTATAILALNLKGEEKRKFFP